MKRFCQNRRDFLVFAGDTEHPPVRFGMVTDIPCADKAAVARPRGVVGRRYYRASLKQLDANVPPQVLAWLEGEFAAEKGVCQ